jgi:dihydroneopterin aldolase/2-amino-4-hydroxy-6-hydroxymethyldihydropteridine diphosphokinase
VSSVLSLGTNLGDRIARLRAGLEVIAQHVPVTSVSPVYETAPVGLLDQPAFLNIVATIGSDDPEAVFGAARAAEAAQGRLRSRHWGPRTLDVDVVAVDDIVSGDARLTLPHPRAHERGFVLIPWLALDPAARLPGAPSVRALVAALPDQDVRRVAGPLPLP